MTYFVGQAGVAGGVMDEKKEDSGWLEQATETLVRKADEIMRNIDGIERGIARGRYSKDKIPLMLYYLRGLHLSLSRCNDQLCALR